MNRSCFLHMAFSASSVISIMYNVIILAVQRPTICLTRRNASAGSNNLQSYQCAVRQSQQFDRSCRGHLAVSSNAEVTSQVCDVPRVKRALPCVHVNLITLGLQTAKLASDELAKSPLHASTRPPTAVSSCQPLQRSKNSAAMASMTMACSQQLSTRTAFAGRSTMSSRSACKVQQLQ